jgi:hypothetical protein
LEDPDFEEKENLVKILTWHLLPNLNLTTRLNAKAISIMILVLQKYRDLIAERWNNIPRVWMATWAGITWAEFTNEMNMSLIVTARHHPSHNSGVKLSLVLINRIHTMLATPDGPEVSYNTW